MENDDRVDVGIVEKIVSWKLSSHLFPSKVGGKPAWLCLQPLPDVDDLKCAVCSEPFIFLLQLYAPLEKEANSFHRTFFIFACRNPDCCKICDSRNFVVFRSDLPRKNEFYSYLPPNYEVFDPDEKYSNAADFQQLCVLCGCPGSKKCSVCKKATYCSKAHQVIDWKSGHKSQCSSPDFVHGTINSPHLFTEYELKIVSEYLSDDSNDADDEEDEEEDDKDIERRMKEFKKQAKNSKYSVEELEEMSFGKSDKSLEMFKKTIRSNLEQVVRHNRGGEPLWITDDNQLKLSDVPKCQYCDSDRHFEFQVMPHLISKLNLDRLEHSIDWGILAIYSCSNNCTSTGTNYRKEYLYKQDFQPRK